MNKHKFKQTEIGMIPEDWNVKKVEEVAIINESNIDNYFNNDEIEYIDISSVENGRILEIQKLKLDEAPSRAKRLVKQNDVLISTVRPNLKHFVFVKNAEASTVASTGFAVISSKKIVPRFLYYYLTTDKYTEFLTAIADTHTSTYPAYNPDVIEQSFIPYPSFTEQQAIAKILSDLDDKIELNQQMNKTLEAIGQAIFKHWFIDFEFPNEEGKPYKSSGGEMVDSELCEIPKGWSVGTIKELVDVSIGGDWVKDTEFGDSVKCISLRGVDLENIKSEGYSKEAPPRFIKRESLERRRIREGDIIIAGSGLGPIGRTIFVSKGLIQLYEMPLTYSNFCKRLTSKKDIFSIYVEKILEDLYSSGLMIQYFTGTSIPNLDLNSLLNHVIIIPAEKQLSLFHQIIVMKYSKLNNKENIILSQIRDSLLPKLMSGKIRV